MQPVEDDDEFASLASKNDGGLVSQVSLRMKPVEDDDGFSNKKSGHGGLVSQVSLRMKRSRMRMRMTCYFSIREDDGFS